MKRIVCSYALIAALALVSVHAQSKEKPQTLAAHVTVTSSASGQTTAVLGRESETGDPLFMFCISHDKLATALAVKGPARVTFVPQPIAGLPAGVKVSGPEPVANVLGIAPEAGPAVVFAAKGQTLQEPSLQKATTIPVTLVRRTDWTVGKGPRRGVSVEGCLAPAG
jgi:hypothetical protein